jgi:hypothetical protein
VTSVPEHPSGDEAPTTTTVPTAPAAVARWPLLLIALPAFVAIWSGWVGLGRLTGFGPVVLLPGIADKWVIDSSITLPIGVETYAAYAMFVWLAPSSSRLSVTARRFARWSSIGSLVLGMAGQVAYHLMSTSGVTAAPPQITAFVACLPVVVLGCAAALVHLTHQTTADNTARPNPVSATGVAAPAVLVEQRPAPVVPAFAPIDLADTDEAEAEQLLDDEDQDDEHDDADQDTQELDLNHNHDVPWDCDYRNTALPLLTRIDLVVAADLAAGAKRAPGQRRIAEMLGGDVKRYDVRVELEKRAAEAPSNGQRRQETNS